jgi:hypothetical protein
MWKGRCAAVRKKPSRNEPACLAASTTQPPSPQAFGAWRGQQSSDGGCVTAQASSLVAGGPVCQAPLGSARFPPVSGVWRHLNLAPQTLHNDGDGCPSQGKVSLKATHGDVQQANARLMAKLAEPNGLDQSPIAMALAIEIGPL